MEEPDQKDEAMLASKSGEAAGQTDGQKSGGDSGQKTDEETMAWMSSMQRNLRLRRMEKNNTRVVTIDGYEDVPRDDEKILKKAVAHQPIIATEPGSQAFQLYKSVNFYKTFDLS